MRCRDREIACMLKCRDQSEAQACTLALLSLRKAHGWQASTTGMRDSGAGPGSVTGPRREWGVVSLPPRKWEKHCGEGGASSGSEKEALGEETHVSRRTSTWPARGNLRQASWPEFNLSCSRALGAGLRSGYAIGICNAKADLLWSAGTDERLEVVVVDARECGGVGAERWQLVRSGMARQAVRCSRLADPTAWHGFPRSTTSPGSRPRPGFRRRTSVGGTGRRATGSLIHARRLACFFALGRPISAPSQAPTSRVDVHCCSVPHQRISHGLLRVPPDPPNADHDLGGSRAGISAVIPTFQQGCWGSIVPSSVCGPAVSRAAARTKLR